MNQVATKQASPLALLGQNLQGMRGNFMAALPSHIPADKFIKTVLTTASLNPSLVSADRQTFYAACMKAAQDGLIIDGREAAIVVFGGKCQYMPMVAGLMKKARNSGLVTGISSQLVHRNDKFSYNPAVDKAPNHNPDWFGDRGELVGVYAVFYLKDGGTHVEIMSKDQVEKIRSRSRSGKAGPWVTDWEEMAKKTVIRRGAKYVPSSSDRTGSDNLVEAIQTQDDEDSVNTQTLQAIEGGVEQIEAPKTTADSKLDNLEARNAVVAETVNPETVEVTGSRDAIAEALEPEELEAMPPIPESLKRK